MKLRLALVAALLAVSTVPLFAETVYVTARPQPSGAGANQDGSYSEVAIILGDTSALSAAQNIPPHSGSRYYAKGVSLTDPFEGIDLMPTLTNGPVYQVDYSQNTSAGNVSTDAVFTVSGIGCTPSFTNTDRFQRKYTYTAGSSLFTTNGWTFMGYITNDPGVTQPILSFRWESGDVNAATNHNNRWIIDTFRFTLVTPCLSVPAVTVNGPLAAGSLSPVTVTGVSATATAVSCYQDNGSGPVLVGRTTTGIAATTIVNCTNLVKGARVSATQTVGGQEGCVQTGGILVGGGANPRLRFALSVRYAPSLTGPIGANGSGTSCIWYLGATNTVSPGAGPGDCKNSLYPSNTWQTVYFTRDGDGTNGPDSAVIWNNNGCGATLDGQYGILESIAIAEGDTSDTGPVDIYIDNLKNGDTMIQDFESGTPGSGLGFQAPGFSGSTSGFLLTAPNSAVVSTNAADGGLQSLRLQFQYNAQATNNWVRLTTSGAAGTPNPQIDLTKPISFRVLMIPVGGTLPHVVTAPTLAYSQSGGQITLNWSGSFKLQYKNSLSDATWTDTGVTSGPYNVPTPLNASRFYRLQGQ